MLRHDAKCRLACVLLAICASAASAKGVTKKGSAELSRPNSAAPASVAPASSFDRALQALREGRVVDARVLLQEDLQRAPEHEVARKLLAQLLIDAGRKDEAEAVLDKAREPDALSVLARLQDERGRPDLALASLMRAAPDSVGNGDYWAFAGYLAQRCDQHKQALAFFDAALKSPHAQVAWLLALAKSQRAVGELDAARASVDEALSRGGLSPAARSDAQLMQRDIRNLLAIRARSDALAQEPATP